MSKHYNKSAEEAAIAAILSSPKPLAAIAADTLKIDDFYYPYHRHYYKAILGLQREGFPIDVVTVAERMRREGTLDQAGGQAALGNLLATAGSAENGIAYIEIVRSLARKREMLDLLRGHANLLSDNADQDRLSGHLDLILKKVEELAPPSSTNIEFLDLQSLWDVEEETPWVFHKVFARDDLIVLGAEFGTGKTWFAHSLAITMATGKGLFLEQVPMRTGRVLYLDRENPKHLIRKRLRKLWPDKKPPEDLRYLWYPQASFDKQQGRDFLKRLFEAERPCLAIFDTLSKFHSKNENKADEMTPVLEFAQQLARQFECAVVLLHHYNKDDGVKKAKERLRGSSAISDNADQIIALENSGRGIRVAHTKARHDAPFQTMICEVQDNPDGLVEIVVTEHMSTTKGEENALEIAKFVKEEQERLGIGPLRSEVVSHFRAKKWSERRVDRGLADAVTRGSLRKGREGASTRYRWVEQKGEDD